MLSETAKDIAGYEGKYSVTTDAVFILIRELMRVEGYRRADGLSLLIIVMVTCM